MTIITITLITKTIASKIFNPHIYNSFKNFNLICEAKNKENITLTNGTP